MLDLLHHRATHRRTVGRRVGDLFDTHAHPGLVAPFEGEASDPDGADLPVGTGIPFDDVGRNVSEAHPDARHPLFGGDGPCLDARRVAVVAGAQREGQEEE